MINDHLIFGQMIIFYKSNRESDDKAAQYARSADGAAREVSEQVSNCRADWALGQTLLLLFRIFSTSVSNIIYWSIRCERIGFIFSEQVVG